MLRTTFPRPWGDIGNPATFGSRVEYEVVEDATPNRVMDEKGWSGALSVAFAAARDRLVARGARLVTTSCGALVVHQKWLSEACPVPVTTSALLQLPRRIAEFGSVGVIAMDAKSIGPRHLAASGAPIDIPIVGLEQGSELYPVLRANRPDVRLDPERAEADVVEAGRRLLEAHPDLRALVLECTNLPPYRAALSRTLGLPVFDILTWLEEIWAEASETRHRPHVTETTCR